MVKSLIRDDRLPMHVNQVQLLSLHMKMQVIENIDFRSCFNILHSNSTEKKTKKSAVYRLTIYRNKYVIFCMNRTLLSIKTYILNMIHLNSNKYFKFSVKESNKTCACTCACVCGILH